ncbi:MAG: hypothetical protein RBU29_01305 [bacterium]|nr:hypothetical protein [bacterium]
MNTLQAKSKLQNFKPFKSIFLIELIPLFYEYTVCLARKDNVQANGYLFPKQTKRMIFHYGHP